MIEYLHKRDFPHGSEYGAGDQVNIVKNGKLEELGKEGWDLVSVDIINEQTREWVFKRVKIEPKAPAKKRGRPAGSKNKVKKDEA